MQVSVLYFGVLKELLDRDGERMELPEDASVGTLLGTLPGAVRGAQPENAAIWRSLAVAVNLEYADSARTLHEGDEVALLPPVSGGSGGPNLQRFNAKERRGEAYVPSIAKDKDAMDGAPAPGGDGVPFSGRGAGWVA